MDGDVQTKKKVSKTKDCLVEEAPNWDIVNIAALALHQIVLAVRNFR